MTESLTIAAAAYPLSFLPDFSVYAAKITAWVEEAAQKGAEILVFPEYAAMELASLGGPEVAQDLHAALSEAARHRALAETLHAELAQQHRVFILMGSGPAVTAKGFVNRASFFGPTGLIGHQDKQIMTRFEREEWQIAPGQDGLAVFATPKGSFGVTICYDSEFPLLARALAEAGAEVFLVPSCTETVAGFYRVRVGAMARALENQCIAVHAPLVGEAPWCAGCEINRGRAAIYGPPDQGWPETGLLVEGAMDTPGWVVAQVDLSLVGKTRAQGTVLPWQHWPEQHRALAEKPRKLAPRP